jgi:hypothetical protein
MLPILPFHDSGVEEVKLHMNFMANLLIMCMSNLSADGAHYGKLNHEISGQTNSNVHVVGARLSGLFGTIRLFTKVVFKR